MIEKESSKRSFSMQSTIKMPLKPRSFQTIILFWLHVAFLFVIKCARSFILPCNNKRRQVACQNVNKVFPFSIVFEMDDRFQVFSSICWTVTKDLHNSKHCKLNLLLINARKTSTHTYSSSCNLGWFWMLLIDNNCGLFHYRHL